MILSIATVIFVLARPITLLFTSAEDSALRRHAWYVLTIAAFVMPTYWWFAAIAIPVLIKVGRKDSNPAACYLFLLHVVPPISIVVPMIGMSFLFYIDNYLLLSLCLLLPVLWRFFRSEFKQRAFSLETMDVILLAYCALQAVFYLHIEISVGVINQASATDAVRRAVVFAIGNFAPYFTFSRLCTTRGALIDAMASFCVICAVMASIAIFENYRHWLLYPDFWGYHASINSYLTRGDSLRAMASSGHSLVMGYLLAIAYGFWLFLQSQVRSAIVRALVSLLFWFGLFAAYSRGPWVGAAVIYFVYTLLRPQAYKKLTKSACLLLFVAIGIGFTPLRDKIVNVLPFFGGSVDNANVVYRQKLFDHSLQLLRENPWLGDQSAVLKLQDLRQGQGIIDFVNSYMEILLGGGIVGLSLFLAFILVGLIKTLSLGRRIRALDPQFGDAGAALAACILGTLLMIENASFVLGYEKIFYVLAGMSAAYARAVNDKLKSGTQISSSAQPKSGQLAPS